MLADGCGDDNSFYIDESSPYAELWLGTHPNGMSRVTIRNRDSYQRYHYYDEEAAVRNSDRQSLLEYVMSNPSLHCGTTTGLEDADLGFLLKVSSVQNATPIQARPDKALVEKLSKTPRSFQTTFLPVEAHAEDVDGYQIQTDPISNQPGSMSIAMTTCRVLYGFRPVTEIVAHIGEHPGLRSLIGEDVSQLLEQCGSSSASTRSPRLALRRMFKRCLEASEQVARGHVQGVVNRIRNLDSAAVAPHHGEEARKLVLLLEEQYPGDVGVLAPLFLNIVTIEPGQAFLIAPNEPHAYVSGEMIECMASTFSGNAIQAGLTSDISTLTNMLTYESGKPGILGTGTRIDDCTRRYQPPVPDFCVDMIELVSGETYTLPNIESSPSMLLTLDGDAMLSQQLEKDDDDDDGTDASDNDSRDGSGSPARVSTSTTTTASLDVCFGSAVFLSAGTSCTVTAGPYGIRLVRAYRNVYM